MKKLLLFLSLGFIVAWVFRPFKKRGQQEEVLTSSIGDSPFAKNDVNSNFRLTSPAFTPGQKIPVHFTCEGEDISLPFSISGAPERTETFAFIMDDPDSPMPPVFDHWLMWNIPGNTTDIIEGRVPEGAVQGKNTLKNEFYNGPCTPNGTHHYHFKLFALDCSLDLPAGSSKKELETAMKGHILAKAEMIGLYSASLKTQEILAAKMLETAVK